MPLTATQIKHARFNPDAKLTGKENRLSDGDSLFLYLEKTGGKYWRMPYRFGGKQKLFSVGVYCSATSFDHQGTPLPEKVVMSLAEARQRRDEAKALLRQGLDPMAARQIAKEQAAQASANSFAAVALEWHDTKKPSDKWGKNHAARIWRRIEADLLPSLGHMSIEEIRTKHLLATLRLIEARGAPSVASRVAQYANAILRYAVQTGRLDSNPAADLAGALTTPKASHRAALPLNRLPELLHKIGNANVREITRCAFELTMLTFLRSSELRMARWQEVDFERAVWTIPPVRVPLEGVKHSERGAKMQTEHIVPLSMQAIAVLHRLKRLNGRSDLMFPSDRSYDRPLSENTLNKALRTMGYATHELCGHGFRTMACSALNESGQWNRDAIERQMSHQERDNVRAAYMHKAEFLKERYAMMQWWADFLDAQRTGSYVEPTEFLASPTVVPLLRKKSG